MKHLIINSNGKVLNNIKVDPDSGYEPPGDRELLAVEDDHEYRKGQIYDKETGEFTQPEEPEHERTVTEYVDREKISPDTKEKIKDAKEAGDLDLALDHVLDVLDVIDLDN